MKTTIEHYAIREEDAPTCLTTTIYDLMTALHAVVEPHEDALVVDIVVHWLQTGRITLLGKAAARRRLQRSATMALCRWGFDPSMLRKKAFPAANHRLQGLTMHAEPPSMPICTLETTDYRMPSS